MSIICENKSSNRKRRCIVVAECDGGSSMVYRGEAILLAQSTAAKACMETPTQVSMRGTDGLPRRGDPPAQSTAAKACMETPTQVSMRGTVVGLKFKRLLQQCNCLGSFRRHPCEDELL